MSAITFEAPPTVAAFMRSESFYKFILGPVGSGKTTGCLFELLRRACEQSPSPIDGIRYTRFAILRQTLQQLKTTVLKDIVQWFGPIASWRVSESTIYVKFGDVHSEWLLLPLENPEDQRRLLSMQLTAAMISEFIEIDSDLLPAIAGRCGRYPSANDGGATWVGVIGDSNFPSESSTWYELIEGGSPDMEFFKQPGGLAPNAENLPYLLQTAETLQLPVTHPQRIAQGRKYYERLSRASNPDWVQRYVNAQYAPDPTGAAVFRNMFKASFHCVDDLDVLPGAPLLVGMDFGRDPVCIITQLDHRGRLLVLGEIAAEDIGLTGQMPVIRAHLSQSRYLGRRVVIVGDPSGAYKNSIDERTSFDVVKSFGFAAMPAPTNEIDARLRTVERFLLEQRDGGPAIIFDRGRCPMLVKAMAGGYRFSFDTRNEAKPKPDKNEYSHYADALQYAALGATGATALSIARMLSRSGRSAARTPVTAGGWT